MISVIKINIKSFIFILIAYFTKNIENEYNYKSLLNHYFYFRKCKRIYKDSNKFVNTNYQDLNGVLDSQGYACLNTTKSKKTAKSILNTMKKDISKYFDSKGRFINGCLIKSFPELKDFIQNELDVMFKHILKSNYKIYDMQAFYSKSKDIPESGSELPHTDTEPAPTIKCQFNLTDVNQDNAMALIRWDKSLKLLFKMTKKFLLSQYLQNFKNRDEIRNEKVKILKDLISKNKVDFFKPNSQEGGLLYFFNNNTIHWGGHLKEKGNERVVITFRVHCSHKDNLNNFFDNTDKMNFNSDKPKFLVPEDHKVWI